VKVELENQLRCSVGKSKSMCVLLGGNDTVPISVRRGRTTRSTELQLLNIEVKNMLALPDAIVDFLFKPNDKNTIINWEFKIRPWDMVF